MPLDIKATGATFNAMRNASLGEFDETKALELTVGKAMGAMTMGIRSTIRKEQYTQALVDYGRGMSVKDKDAAKRIKALEDLAANPNAKLDNEDLVINPVNFLGALTCLGKNEDKAALRILRLYFALKRAESRMLDSTVSGYFGAGVRQAVSGGFVEAGREKLLGWNGFAVSADLTIDKIAERLGIKPSRES